MKHIQNVTFLAYAIPLSIWSGNISERAGGLWFAGVILVAGWLASILSYELWRRSFTLMGGLGFFAL